MCTQFKMRYEFYINCSVVKESHSGILLFRRRRRQGIRAMSFYAGEMLINFLRFTSSI